MPDIPGHHPVIKEESDMPSSIIKIPYNPTMEGLAEVFPDVVYSVETGQELKLTLIAPWRDWANETAPPKRPLIVFVQGSAFTFPNIYYELPQLSHYARHGYVVATVTHRNCLEGHPFPAYLQDVKTAIRFLRKNAEEYGIDAERIGIWGTSSGGNTALLVGLTAGDPAYLTGEHEGVSDEVKCVVDCFGPTDMTVAERRVKDVQDPRLLEIFYALMGGKEDREVLKAMSPLHRIQKGRAYPPFLIVQGDADTLVPYEQSLGMYEALLEAGCQAEMICVENGPHEGTFWSWALHQHILDFFKKHL
jgi:acetyl esterase/lipase